MKTILAVYEDGVFKPVEPVDLPEHCRVLVEPQMRPPETAKQVEVEDAIHRILGERYHSGDPYGAERHDEHQP